MKIINLYTYDGMKRLITKQYAKLDSGPIVFNAVNSEYILEGFLQPGIYDAEKENRTYLNLIEYLGFGDLSFEDLAKLLHNNNLVILEFPVFILKKENYKESLK